MTNLKFEKVSPPPDSAAITCAFPGCSESLEYSGSGAKPKFCETHSLPRSSTAELPKTAPKNQQLALQAAEALSTINSLTCLGIMAFGLPLTATAIMEENTQFKTNAYNALLSSPDLCQKIVGVGGKSAGMALAAAYGFMALTAVPVAVLEIQTKREEAARLREESVDGTGS